MPQLANDLTAQKPQFPNHRNASIKRLQDRFHGKSLPICNAVAGRVGPQYPTAAVILHPQGYAWCERLLRLPKHGCAWTFTITPAYGVIPTIRPERLLKSWRS